MNHQINIQEVDSEEFDFNPFRECYELIEMGRFSEAEDKVKTLIGKIASEDRIYNLIKQLRFWIEHTEKMQTEITSKSAEIKYLQKDFYKYEIFIKKYGLYDKNDFATFRKAIFGRMVNNHIYEFNHEDENHHEDIYHLARVLYELKDYQKAEETLIYLRKLSHQKEYQIDFLLANVFFQQKKERKALLHLKDSFFWHDQYDYRLIEIPSFYPLINRLLAQNYHASELSLWLPVHAKLDQLLDINSMFSKATFKKMLERVEKIRVKYEKSKSNLSYIEPKLLYGYLYILDQIYLKIQKGNHEFIDDLNLILYKIDGLNSHIYHKIKNNYA